MNLRSYENYKVAELDATVSLPEHWEESRLKFFSSIIAGQSPASDTVIDGLNGLPFLQGNADFGDFNPTPRQACDKAPKIASAGDILLSVRAPVGEINVADQAYGIGRGLCAIRPLKGIDSRLVFYILQAARKHFDSVSTGSTFDAVSTKQVGQLLSVLPPSEEQAQISSFLDRETAKIDALVEEQRRLIELLKEKRQAAISQAVTKGLDPNVPMKDSGVDWLGKVPAHWTVCALRRVIASIEQGWSPECEAAPADDQSWGVLKAGCVNRGVFDASENKSLPDALMPIAEYEVRSGDVLVSRASGSPELVGSTALVGEIRNKLMLSDKIFRVHLTPRMTSPFFVWAMNGKALREQIERALSGGNGLANNLPQSAMLAFLVAVPPIEEQRIVSTAIEGSVRKCDELIAEATRAVNFLQERRAAIISAAVTGKIDVRNHKVESA